jgi:hypothetical protein
MTRNLPGELRENKEIEIEINRAIQGNSGKFR